MDYNFTFPSLSKDDLAFENLALEIFRYQATENEIYSRFLSGMKVKPTAVKSILEIPFLPVEFFKNHTVYSGSLNGAEVIFSSSGTTGMAQSRHFVKDIEVYKQSFKRGFEFFYGDIKDYLILALLPSYSEREGSSLIYMVDELIKDSANANSGYFLYNHQELFNKLNDLKSANKKTLLIGVTYALLDFIENHAIHFPDLIVMETGGMKGKRKEMIREELHFMLKAGFGVPNIHSEYGMTELLSQAYSKGEGVFECPPWMKVLARDTNDPLSYLPAGYTGGCNIIDFANVYSCSFIATQDLVKVYEDGRFEVLGRFDNSDVRGCNLLVG